MLDINNTCLFVIDIQGKLAQLMHKKEAVYRNIQILIQGAQLLKMPILWTEQVPEKLGPTIPEIADLLPGQSPLTKSSFSCYGDSVTVSKLKQLNRKQVIVTGIETHICVFQTVADLLEDGYEVHLIGDAVSSRSPKNRRIAINRMESLGAIISSTEMALFELLRTAEADAFRSISKLIK